MKNLTHIAAIALSAGLAASISTAAHTQSLIPAGELFDYANIGNTFTERTIPDLPGSIVRFTVIGADGGDAQVGNNGQCLNGGGEGATSIIQSVIDDGNFFLNPGRRMRFIVGQQGSSDIDLGPNRGAAGAGGGGSAVLYDSVIPSSPITALAVSGGGGGAYVGIGLGICGSPDQNGRSASTTECGSSGNPGNGGDGRCDGRAGEGIPTASGGGGGRLNSADGLGGKSGGNNGGLGGSGGFESGGFGYGGGGAARDGGGGGGGYSGGGGGRPQHAGGGGGSFVNTPYALGTPTISVIPDGLRHGRIVYSFVGQTHDEISNAINVSNLTTFSGTTQGATISDVGGTCSVNSPDVWYFYTNNTDCTQFVTFSAAAGLVGFSYSLDGSTICDAPSPTLPREVAVGQTVFLRVTSQDPTFTIDILAEAFDTDNDGICDDVDICIGVDDATLDPANDVDSDGIHDVCDKACQFDFFPDGEFTFDDWNLLNFGLAFGDPLLFDYNNSGEYEFFDTAAFLNWCQ